MKRTRSQCNGRPRVNVHLYTAALANDSRFFKQARSILGAGLADEVVLMGRATKGQPLEETLQENIRFLRFKSSFGFLPKFKPFGCLKYLEFICREIVLSQGLRPSIIHCHSISSLPAAIVAKRLARAPVVYDARELETEGKGLRGINRRFTRLVERTLIRHCDSVLCVSDSIANWYAKAYHIRRPYVVRNIPDIDSQSAAPSQPQSMRGRFRVPEQALLFVYSGALFPSRRVEQLIRVFRQAGPSKHLVFMGFGPLESLVRSASVNCSNIHFQPAVPPSEVLAWIGTADVGIIGVENTCLSYYLSLPNKLFEYLLSGLPFLAPDYPEMRGLIENHHCGWVVGESDDNWCAAVRNLNHQAVDLRRNSALSARSKFSWADEEKRLIQAYHEAKITTNVECSQN